MAAPFPIAGNPQGGSWWSPLNQGGNLRQENSQFNYILQNGNTWTPVPFTVGSAGGYSTWLLAFGDTPAGGNSSSQGLYTLPAGFLNGSAQSSMWLGG